MVLENERVKLMPLTMENFHHLILVASEEKLVQYSPSSIETPEKLKEYVRIALEQQALACHLLFTTKRTLHMREALDT